MKQILCGLATAVSLLTACSNPDPTPDTPVSGKQTSRSEKEPQEKKKAPERIKADIDTEAWMSQYAAEPVDLGDWKKRTGGVHGGWFDSKSADCARNYLTTWGPLGIRTRMLDENWSNEKAFKERWPDFLTDSNGDLLINCFEVVEVWPGSPADGQLKAGDYLLAMDGQNFLSGSNYKKAADYRFIDSRSLELHAGELLDQAEGRGNVSFKVLRPPTWETIHESEKLHRDSQSSAKISTDITGAIELRLIAEKTGKKNDYCWANWLQPQLRNSRGKILDLSTAKMLQSKTGWGKTQRGIDSSGKAINASGKVIEKSLGTHADSVLTFAVPEGYNRFSSTLQLGTPRAAGFKGRIEIKKGLRTKKASLWQTLATQSFMNHRERQKPMILNASLRGDQRFRLTVSDGGNGKGSDGFDWQALKLVNSEGEEIPLHTLKARRKQTGWARIKIDEAKADWWVHAHSVLEFDVPQGQWTLSGSGKPSGGGTVVASLEVRDSQTALPQEITPHISNISFQIPKIGSFAQGFPYNCRKTANTVAITAAWLAKQQLPDGSFPRPHGYTSRHYDTGWAGLALMATGNKQFDPNIRKAAHWLARSETHDGWAVPAGAALLFLGEYWLRHRDDKVLNGLQNWVDRVCSEMIYGDMTAGHGHNPGYRGTGVSVGGSALAAALAVATKTPAQVPDGLVDRMLARAQELGPDGFLPYGRGTGTTKFEPNLTSGATYSGRHGPYLIASLIHGGPEIFTKNCSKMYAHGPVGGIDQGHATKTLSIMWALPAVANVDKKAFQRHMEAMKWQMTMLRCYNGGYCNNAFRLEFQGGESLLDFAIRTACYTIALCADRKNLAITGAPQYRAEKLKPVIPRSHRDATLYNYYLRNWAVSAAVLRDKAPAELKSGLVSLKKLKLNAEFKLFDFMQQNAPKAAKAVMQLQDVDKLKKNYIAEMLLGIDHRITILPEKANDKVVPGKYSIELISQHPFAGKGQLLDKEQLPKWLAQAPKMAGSVSIEDPGKYLDKKISFEIHPEKQIRWNGWHTQNRKTSFNGPAKEALKLQARFQFKAAGIDFDYTRPLLINQDEEWGGGERGRPVTNDRRFQVPGTLINHHNRWNISFLLPDGEFISAATQGNQIMVRDSRGDWVSPIERSLTAGSKAEFTFTSGWQHFEARIPEITLIDEKAPIAPARITFNTPVKAGEASSLTDGIRENGMSLVFPESSERQITVRVDLATPEKISALDLRLSNKPAWWTEQAKLDIKAEVDGAWQTVYRGKLDAHGIISKLIPTTTAKLRINIRHSKWKTLELGELRLY